MFPSHSDEGLLNSNASWSHFQVIFNVTQGVQGASLAATSHVFNIAMCVSLQNRASVLKLGVPA
jgi:hypothetical protein